MARGRGKTGMRNDAKVGLVPASTKQRGERRMILANISKSFAMDHFWRRLRPGLVVLALATVGGEALAQDADGVWLRNDGAARIQFSPCGKALCGVVVWLKNPASKAHVGQQVFFDMVRADQDSWSGQAINPEDGRTYRGKMVLTGKKLKTSGCVLGGLICKTVVWRRFN